MFKYRQRGGRLESRNPVGNPGNSEELLASCPGPNQDCHVIFCWIVVGQNYFKFGYIFLKFTEL
jgi:hypothetical protein